jgi:predicted dehydrogenase
MNKPIIALVGCGRWGSLILRDLNLIGCEVRVVIHSKRSTENAYKGGACSTHPSIQSMRADCGKPAGFVVAVPARFHFQTILEILDTFGADIPIFCEKPLTVNSADAKRLCATGAPIFVMDKWRYHPAVRKVTEAVREDQFGPLRSVSLSRVQGGNPHPDVPTAWTYLPHDLAIVLEIMGTIPKVVRSYSGGSGGLILAELEDAGGPKVFLECSTIHLEKKRHFEAVFGFGKLSMTDPLDEFLRLDGVPTRPMLIPIPGEMPLLLELKAFVEFLGGGEPPKSSCADGLRVVQSVEEILGKAVVI